MKTKMTNEKEEYTFAESESAQVPNFGANTTTDEGTNLFPQVGKKLTLQVTNWEMGFADPKTGKAKPIIQLKMDNGSLYQRVLGSDMKRRLLH